MQPNRENAPDDGPEPTALELAGLLRIAALGSSQSRPAAATALLTAAAAILVEDFGTIVGIELLQSSIDEAGAQWRANLH